MTLPIDSRLDAIRSALADHSRALLVAEPGAGKTTRVPLALLAAPWAAGCCWSRGEWRRYYAWRPPL